MENFSIESAKEELKRELGSEKFNSLFKQHINFALIEHTSHYNSYSSWLTAGEGAFLIALSSQYKFLSTNLNLCLLNIAISIIFISVFAGTLLKLFYIILIIQKSVHNQIHDILNPSIQASIDEKINKMDSSKADRLNYLFSYLSDTDKQEVLGTSINDYCTYVYDNTPGYLRWYLTVLKIKMRSKGIQKKDPRISSVITISFLFMFQMTTLILGFLVFLISLF